MILTPWFDGKIKPVFPGVYMQRAGIGQFIGYQRWTGHHWMSWCLTIEEAASEIHIADPKYQNDSWCGLRWYPGLEYRIASTSKPKIINPNHRQKKYPGSLVIAMMHYDSD